MLHIREKKKVNIQRKKGSKSSDNTIHQMLIVCLNGRKVRKRKGMIEKEIKEREREINE